MKNLQLKKKTKKSFLEHVAIKRGTVLLAIAIFICSPGFAQTVSPENSPMGKVQRNSTPIAAEFDSTTAPFDITKQIGPVDEISSATLYIAAKNRKDYLIFDESVLKKESCIYSTK